MNDKDLGTLNGGFFYWKKFTLHDDSNLPSTRVERSQAVVQGFLF